MTTYREALEKMLDNIRVMGIEEKPLFKCLGQVLAEDVSSEHSLPLAAQSGPDGYAVRAEDIKNASEDNPVTLEIIETVRAGYLPANAVKPGTAIRIMTGTVLPEGADCVVRFEDTDEPLNKSGPNKDNPSKVKIFKSSAPGLSIVKAGSNVKKGALVLSKGTIVGPAQISVLTIIGKAKVKVFRRPVVAVIATGDELISLGKPLVPGKSYNCNTAAVAALVSHYGGTPKILGIAKDDEKSLLTKMQKGMEMDAIITSGGVSKGDYDLVRVVIGKLGEVIFSRINMGPGASVAFGRINKAIIGQRAVSIPVFALTGPPTGCLINFETFVRPALFKMMGSDKLSHPVIEALAQDSVSLKRPMAFVQWSKLEKVDGEYRVEIDTAGRIGSLAAIAAANSFTIIPEEIVVNQGDKISVLPLDWVTNFD